MGEWYVVWAEGEGGGDEEGWRYCYDFPAHGEEETSVLGRCWQDSNGEGFGE